LDIFVLALSCSFHKVKLICLAHRSVAELPFDELCRVLFLRLDNIWFRLRCRPGANALVVTHFQTNLYGSTFLSEFNGVGQEIKNNLYVPPLISVDFLEESKVFLIVHLYDQVDPSGVKRRLHHLGRLKQSHIQTKVGVRELKTVVFKLGQVKQIIYQILHHLLGKKLFLKHDHCLAGQLVGQLRD